MDELGFGPPPQRPSVSVSVPVPVSVPSSVSASVPPSSVPPPSSLPLSHPWSFFFSDTSSARRSHSYSAAINRLITCESVPSLCASANALGVPAAFSHLRVNQNIHFFRSAVTPEWEHPWNEKGGRFTLTPPPAQISHVFLLLVLLLAGSSLELDIQQSSPDPSAPGGTLLGVVAARRGRGDRIEIWVGGSLPGAKPAQQWLDALRAALANELPGVEIPKYKQHF